MNSDTPMASILWRCRAHIAQVSQSRRNSPQTPKRQAPTTQGGVLTAGIRREKHHCLLPLIKALSYAVACFLRFTPLLFSALTSRAPPRLPDGDLRVDFADPAGRVAVWADDLCQSIS